MRRTGLRRFEHFSGQRWNPPCLFCTEIHLVCFVLKSTLSVLCWNPPCLFCAEIRLVCFALKSTLSLLRWNPPCLHCQPQEFAQLPGMVECHEVTRDMLFHFILIIVQFLEGGYTQGCFKKKGTQSSKFLEHLPGKEQFKEKMNSYEIMNLHTHTHTHTHTNTHFYYVFLTTFS